MRVALKQAIDESFVYGFRLVMLTALGLALVSALVAFTVIDNTGNAKCRPGKRENELSSTSRSERVTRAMTQRAFIDLCSGFEVPFHHTERETALLTVD